jgi:flagellar basal body-associated protein FliL
VKKILPLLLGILLAGGGFGVYTMFLSGGGGKKETPAQAQAAAKKLLATAKKARIKAGIDGPIVSAGDPFVVNRADPGLAHCAKCSVSLLVDSGTPLAKAAADAAAAAPALEEQAQARDLIIDDVSSHSATELSTAAGRDVLKKQIIASIDTSTEKTVVLGVYITDFAIQ